jgi:transcriptional regulator with XRE-family HTH domain
MSEPITLLSMPTFRERLRQLREARKISQKRLAARLDRPQPWISNRELGKVEISVDEAIEILRAIGYAAEMVVVEGGQDQLLKLAAQADPAQATLALQLLEVLPRLDEGQRRMLTAMIHGALATPHAESTDKRSAS